MTKQQSISSFSVAGHGEVDFALIRGSITATSTGATLDFEEFRGRYRSYPIGVLRKLLRNVDRDRRMLGYLVAHAKGAMTDEDLDRLEDEHLDSVESGSRDEILDLLSNMGEAFPELRDPELLQVGFRLSATEACEIICESNNITMLGDNGTSQLVGSKGS